MKVSVDINTHKMRFYEHNLIKIDVITVTGEWEICWTLREKCFTSYPYVVSPHVERCDGHILSYFNHKKAHREAQWNDPNLCGREIMDGSTKGTVARLEDDLRAPCIIFLPAFCGGEV